MFFKGVELSKQKTIKYCSDNTCTNFIPICCLFITPECSDNLSKWYHLSAGEHVCSVCYNHIQSFFSYENESSELYSWKKSWLVQCHDTPSINDYITNVLLPHWYLCGECNKWRQVDRNINLSNAEISGFHCRLIIKHTDKPCLIPEDQRIDFIRNHPASFFESIKYTVLLESTPYLGIYDEYLLDTVGVCSTAKIRDFDLIEPCEGFMTLFNPFLKEKNHETAAGSIDATSMDRWEYQFFTTFTENLKNVFIGLRNMILLLWAAEPKRPVTSQLVTKCLAIRGLVKVALLINSLSDIIRIYSGFGFINYGFLDRAAMTAWEDCSKIDVIVIGAGLSGLSAARHLSLMGSNVTVLEASEVVNDVSRSIPKKLKIFNYHNEIYGNINNPFTVMAHQCNIALREVSTNLSIFDSNGQIVMDDVDQFYQNLVYNFIPYLIEGSSIINNASEFAGCSLADLYRDYRSSRISAQSAIFEALENVYLSEIEFRVFGGVALENISTKLDMGVIRHGIFNFTYKQFSGVTVEPICGWNDVINQLLSGINIQYGSRVTSIGRLMDKYTVLTDENRQYTADKIIVATSPYNYSQISSDIDWLSNRHVIDNVDVSSDQMKESGTFIIIQMQFDQQFWRQRATLLSGTAFTVVPSSAELRGFCHVFKETQSVDGKIILQTQIFGRASQICYQLSDEEIMIRVVNKLMCLNNDSTDISHKPIWYEINRIENVLVTCTDIGVKYRQLSVNEKYETDIFLTGKANIVTEPISLTNSFCVGMEAACNLLRHVL